MNEWSPNQQNPLENRDNNVDFTGPLVGKNEWIGSFCCVSCSRMFQNVPTRTSGTKVMDDGSFCSRVFQQVRSVVTSRLMSSKCLLFIGKK